MRSQVPNAAAPGSMRRRIDLRKVLGCNSVALSLSYMIAFWAETSKHTILGDPRSKVCQVALYSTVVLRAHTE